MSGRNTSIAPTPPITPSMKRDLHKLSGNIIVSQFCRPIMATSIMSMGIYPMMKTTWNMSHIKRKNMGMPNVLLRRILSIL